MVVASNLPRGERNRCPGRQLAERSPASKAPGWLSAWPALVLDRAGKPLVLDFARQFLPNNIDEVRRIFSGKGAYARFKDLPRSKGCSDHWYDFEAKVEEKALRMWCDLNSIEFGD